MTILKVKRVYMPASRSDGFRVLVDRIWPRGLTKEKAALDHWDRNVAPSTELRKWFGHEPEKWPEFRRRYTLELRANKEAVRALKIMIKPHKTVTLLFGAHDEEHNQAIVLASYLRRAART